MICCLSPDIKRILTPSHVIRECQRCGFKVWHERTWPADRPLSALDAVKP